MSPFVVAGPVAHERHATREPKPDLVLVAEVARRPRVDLDFLEVGDAAELQRGLNPRVEPHELLGLAELVDGRQRLDPVALVPVDDRLVGHRHEHLMRRPGALIQQDDLSLAGERRGVGPIAQRQ